MVKHSLRILAVLLVSVFVFGGIAAQDEPVEIVVGGINGIELQWVNETIIPAFEEMMAEQGKNVNVTTLEFVGSGDDQRQQYVLDLGVGAGTDIMTMDGFWLPEFVEGGLLKPLTEVVGPEVLDWEGWSVTPEGLRNILAFGGEIYGLARGTDARVIWYRADLFEQAGLPADWQPTSWEELLDAARTIKENLEGVTPIQLNAGTAMTEATTMQGYLMALLSAGHHIYDFEEGKWIVSSPAILNTLKLYETIYITEELGDARYQLTSSGREESFTDFAEGEIAMLVEGDFFWRGPLAPGGNQAMENRDEVVKFAKMPAMEPGMGFNGQDFVTISGGTGYIINPNTEHPQEAWALLSFMFSKEQVDALQALQPRIRARTDVEVPNDETMSRIASEVLPLTTIRPMLPEYNSVSAAAQLMTERVVSGEMTPEEAMAAYDEEVTALVGEENVIRLPLEE
jgi:multiple sugar transport system substrate-binding protein